ncbi:MAG TPA: alkaline phosphatase family protein, partial [Tepidisphaeraceae bacterium]|nr:alkaline phosphatase family protein [Tepidisphaeraceae bacterium]
MRTPTATVAIAVVLTVVVATLAADQKPPATPAPASTTPATTRVAYRPTTRPIEAVDRVLVISIDGLRPDLLTRADVPNLRALMRGGAFTMWARTTAVSRTLPSHISMLTGVPPHRHEIEWNRDLPLKHALYPKGRTLFDIAKQYGYTTALAAGKTKFDTFERPGAVDWSWIVPATTKPAAANPAKAEDEGLEKDEWPEDKAKVGKASVTDAEVAGRAVRIIREHRPQVMLVHLPHVDFVGHTIGWGSPEQVRAVGLADTAVGH